MRPGIAAGLLALGLAAGGCADAAEVRRIAVGDAAPDYAAVTLDGEPVELAGLRGEPVLLNVWATWCPPCREEMPGLQALHEAYGAQGLRVVGVSIDRASAKSAVRQFMDEHGITFMILLDPEDRVTRTFRLAGVPETYLIDAEGRIARRWIGRFDPLSEEARGAVRATLRADRLANRGGGG